MADSLLAFLYPHIRGSQEDVATLTLCHIISQSDALKKRFTQLLANRLHLVVPTELSFSTQVVGSDKERPDLVGIDANGNETIICEVKFFAALTANQPNGYLKRLQGHSNCGLIFLCPQSRTIGLWNQVQSLAQMYSPQPIDDTCVDMSGVRMSIISWSEVLEALKSAARDRDPGMQGDIQQLDGFCHEIENSEFIPFKEADLGADVAKRLDGYNMVVDSVTDLLLKQDVFHASKRGLRATPQYYGYTQYIRIGDYALGIFFDRSLWKKQSSTITPFWFYMKDKNWSEDDALKSYYRSLPDRMTERITDGNVFIALETPTGCTLEETALHLFKQIMKHISDAETYRLNWHKQHDCQN